MNFEESVFANSVSADAFNNKQLSVDCLVIGSGAGGATVAKELSARGAEVLILEEGGLYGTKDFDRNIGLMISKLYRNAGIQPIHGRSTVAFGEGCCVGGSTVINGGLIWRTPPWILAEWGLKDYSTASLESHFIAVEKDLNVVRHTLSDDGFNRDSLLLAKGAEQLGWKYVMVPRAVNNCMNSNLCATGCPTGAKQSMMRSYLPLAVKNGAKIIYNAKALRLEKLAGNVHQVLVLDTIMRKSFTIKARKFFLSSGAIQSAAILQRSKIAPLAGNKLELHWNLKLVARFKDPVNAQRGTIFTVQMQEFEKEGMLLMGSNFSKNYLAISLSHLNNSELNKIITEQEHYAIYACMIRPSSKASVTSIFSQGPLLKYKYQDEDTIKIVTALRRSLSVLLAAGADLIYLPIKGFPAISTLSEFDKFITQVKPEQFELISVHAMASCSMGESSSISVVDTMGKVWGEQNLYIADASMLPSNIGESPQGTIMAFCRKIYSEIAL